MVMIQSSIRYVLTIIFGFLVGKGILASGAIDSAHVTSVVDVISLVVAGFGAIVWSYFQKRFSGVIK